MANQAPLGLSGSLPTTCASQAPAAVFRTPTRTALAFHRAPLHCGPASGAGSGAGSLSRPCPRPAEARGGVSSSGQSGGWVRGFLSKKSARRFRGSLPSRALHPAPELPPDGYSAYSWSRFVLPHLFQLQSLTHCLLSFVLTSGSSVDPPPSFVGGFRLR